MISCTLSPAILPYTGTVQKDTLLGKVRNSRFDRGGLYGSGVVGLKPYFTGKIPPGFETLYTPKELEELHNLHMTERDVESRMTVKITEHYFRLALRSENLMNLVKARPEETADLSGSVDPSNQNRYIPVPGLLHKYEMVLLFVARTCSAHCRYCYRFDLFTNKSGKSLITSRDAARYIELYNKSPARKYPITEALLSGGDPMILPNTQLAEYIVDLSEAGIRIVRIGTKELAFFPQRFDSNFFEMLDIIHSAFPELRLVFSLHFTHPAEFLEMRGNEYVQSMGPYSGSSFQWMEVTEAPIREFMKRGHFVSLRNQTPIIRNVNDNSADLHLLQKEMFRKGIENHYVFQCRDIQGKKEFAVPVEESWRLFSESQRGLSGMEKHARFVMSTERGKIEVVGVCKDEVIFRVHRSAVENAPENDVMVCKRNPQALWLDDYKHCIVHDPCGIIS